MNKQLRMPPREVGESYWSSLTEEQLLRTAFTTDDPESLLGLIEDVPSSDQLPFVEYWYDFRGTKRERIRCVHCRYHNHLAGYVIRTDNGQRFLVGHECGDKLYGADFEDLRRDYDNARDYAKNLRRWRNLQEALPDFLEWLSELQRCPAVRAYRDTKKAFRDEMPKLFNAIAASLRRDQGVLSVFEQLRDFDAENRAVERYEREKEEWDKLTTTERKNRRRYDGDKGPQPPRLPMFKSVPRPVLTVRANRFFCDYTLPHQELADVVTGFQDLVAEINGATLNAAAYEGRTDQRHRDRRHLFASTFKGVFGRMNTLLDRVRGAADQIAELEDFFRLDGLAALVHWANLQPKINERFALSGKGIGIEGVTRTMVSLPPGFSVLSLDGLEAFIAAVNANDRTG
ncbi:hypothetical protein [Bradyrhizobium sp. USDA 4529]